MLMACISLPGGAWPYATLTLALLRTHTKPSEPQRTGHSHCPLSASHVAIQQDRARSTLLTGLLLKHSARWWLYHCYPLLIHLVVLLCLIHMAIELTAPHLPDTVAITNKKSAPERNSGSAYFPRRDYVSCS